MIDRGRRLDVARVAVAVGLIWPSAARANCAREFEGPRWTSAQLTQAMRATKEPASADQLRTFTTQALPELFRLAEENEMTVDELLADVWAAVTLVAESLDGHRFLGMLATARAGREAARNLETFVGRSKFKASHHVSLNKIIYSLDIFLHFAMREEARRTGTTAARVISTIDRDTIRYVLAAAEDNVMNRTLDLVGLFREKYASFDAFRAEVAARPKPTKVVSPRTSPPDDESVEIDAAIPPDPAPGDSLPVAPGEPTNDLRFILSDDRPLQAGVPYDAQINSGLSITVTLAPPLLKDHDGGEREVIRRLLKSLLVGRAHAGIKMLPELGPKIIEVKAILHGHKRILGCLEGRSVRLLRMIDIKADRKTYFKRIPRDLCD